MFVVQKHHARRAGLHWDFRLEHGSVLWIWCPAWSPAAGLGAAACALAEEPPEGPEWISEIKFDGYRLLAAVTNDSGLPR